ncbi:substrate-binding domain-containing protein [Yeguia hominis]|uniref:Substrate-binding domain-containing protein n=1 Tax=Yeguia hominis TaxID=2763662 RepID=A0A926HQ79_9FIRM|nr:substrate-binding domain-containing protein [Yeguia hominis]MBC8532444.1 substrate-binding domain-containing protein [Yeguia hominis]
MKKIGSLMLVLVLILAAMAGCASGNTESSSSTASAAESQTSQAESTSEPANADLGAISVVSREDGSGTRGAFIELFGIEEKDADGNKIDNTTEEAIVTNSTSVMMTTVAGNPAAIGYISLGSLNDTVKALKIDGADATVENIKSGSYKVSRPFNIATKGTLSEAAQDFEDYILSAEGQAVIEENGYIAADDAAKPYAGKQPSGKVTVAGSSSVTPVMEKLKEAYAAVNPNAEVEIQESDSTTGMNSTIEGICDIGMASRALKDSEKEAGLTETKIAIDGIAVIVNKENSFDGMTSEAVKGVFTGEITDWSSAK